ncbi:proton-coupled amino acid transporter-like protein pathetic isoform X2 [Phymastichus coffea]|nr:proton-coupled amino acid transporter-like protein pathetic isoform X2 [Phymastichus coffea]XP_058802946.1 proton-coupled amino acid transporter-like protein pathetic isoform X2 [Phymastichus coffea]XP_058802947.1 proton-coupled amino acid transporter-like protein pathetic isoform X2 [Phymastichus coffea]
MPSAIKSGGLLFGGVGTLLIGVLCTHCVHILVRSSQALCRKARAPQMTYAEVAAAAFEHGPEPLRGHAARARSLVNWTLCATHVGGICVYVVLIATGLKQLGDHYCGRVIDVRIYMLCLAPALLLIGQIRHLNILVPFSIVANLSLTISLAVTLYYVLGDIQPLDKLHLIADWHQMPKFFATVIFAIEGIGTVMPIENSMKNPKNFIGCPSVLNISMMVVVTLYTLTGLLGYMSFGDAADGSFSNNLPIDKTIGQIAKLLVALSVTLTYGLQYFVPMEIIWTATKHRFGHRWENVGQTVLRVILVLFTVCVAIIVPTLAPFISLVGSIFFSILGICFPAIIETVSCWDGHLGSGYWRVWKNVFLVLFSLGALVTGTWVSVLDILKLYK